MGGSCIGNLAWHGSHTPLVGGCPGAAAHQSLSSSGRSLPSQEVGNTLWAFAVLEHHPGAPLLDAAAAHILRRLEHFGPADTSNSLWAYARLFHYPGPELLQVCCAATARPSPTPQGLHTLDPLLQRPALQHLHQQRLARRRRRGCMRCGTGTASGRRRWPTWCGRSPSSRRPPPSCGARPGPQLLEALCDCLDCLDALTASPSQ